MRRRSILPVTAAAVLALSLAACTAEPAPTPSSSATTTPVTFTFGASSDPASLDPALVTDVDSQRISRQIFEGLVTLDATTGKP
ncbi:ABC transporter substrate-binding protein, partial [Vibrio vulnificus]